MNDFQIEAVLNQENISTVEMANSRIKKIFAGLAFLVLISLPAKVLQSQVWGESYFTLNYSPSAPLGSLKHFIDKPSWISFNGDFMIDIKNHWSAGFGIGYTRFYDRLPRTVYQEASNDISAVQTRQIQLIPLLAKANYVHKAKPSLQFYGGLGVGVGFVSYDKLWGVFEDSNNNTSFRFCLQPNAGAYFLPGKKSHVWIHTGISYMWIPYESFDINAISYLSFNVGVRIPAQ
jgi:hypothetical protein